MPHDINDYTSTAKSMYFYNTRIAIMASSARLCLHFLQPSIAYLLTLHIERQWNLRYVATLLIISAIPAPGVINT